MWANALVASGIRVYWVTASTDLETPSELWNRLLPTFDGSLDRFVDTVTASDSPAVIVLDDADTYMTPAHIPEIVELLRRAPGIRLVIIGHVLPEFPAAVPVARIKSWELHASADELAAIAESVGLQMPRMAVDAVRDSFQGWLTPSLIALRAMTDALTEGRAPEHAYGMAMETATAYVREMFDGTGAVEALKPLWLWKCADELTAETARVAIGIDHPHRVIARLEDEGAVISVEGASPPAWTPNLSPVLSSMLTDEFAERFADETRAAHARLSVWSLDRGDVAGAVTHAVAAEDWDSVADLLTAHWSTLLSTSSDILRASMNALPQHYIDNNSRWSEARNFVNYMPAGPQAAQ